MKKQVILLLSRVFPKYHHKKGRPTGFREALGRTKIHTIRPSYEQWRHNLDKVIDGDFVCSVREWSGLPYKSQQTEFTTFAGHQIGYQRISMTYDPTTDDLKAVIDGRPVRDNEALARNNGLSLPDFKEWYFGSVKSMSKQFFSGIVIHFTEYRYQ